MIRTAPQVTGPWSEPQVFYRPPKAKEDSLFNAGKEHPEFAREGGKVLYMTYIDSSVYVPHTARDHLAVKGGTLGMGAKTAGRAQATGRSSATITSIF